jgi:anti-anti-sigma factor
MPIHSQHRHALPDWIDFFETCPIPVQIYSTEGDMVAFNEATNAMWNVPDISEAPIEFNILTDPQLVALGVPAIFKRAVQGETMTLPPHMFDTAKIDAPGLSASRRWVESTYFPIRNRAGSITHVGLLHRDVTETIEKAQENEATQQQIAEQQSMISELSSPVVKVWDEIIALPLIGSIDTRRATMITENLLESIVQHQASSVIIDITGVAVIDTQVANYLISAAQACRLLGSQVALVGMSSEIAQTMVQLGIDTGSLVTRADLQAGIAWAFQQQGVVVQKEHTRIAGA